MDLSEALGWKKPEPKKASAEQQAKLAADAFNAYQVWFESLDPTDEEMHVDLGGVMIHAFGSNDKKQAAWKARKQQVDWDSFFATGQQDTTKKWGDATAGTSLSSDPPEVWMDLRKTKSGKLVLPLHVLGHEQAHTIWQKDSKAINPDELVNKKTYEYYHPKAAE